MGVQQVALNLQTNDTPTQLHYALFALSGLTFCLLLSTGELLIATPGFGHFHVSLETSGWMALHVFGTLWLVCFDPTDTPEAQLHLVAIVPRLSTRDHGIDLRKGHGCVSQSLRDVSM